MLNAEFERNFPVIVGVIIYGAALLMIWVAWFGLKMSRSGSSEESAALAAQVNIGILERHTKDESIGVTILRFVLFLAASCLTALVLEVARFLFWDLVAVLAIVCAATLAYIGFELEYDLVPLYTASLMAILKDWLPLREKLTWVRYTYYWLAFFFFFPVGLPMLLLVLTVAVDFATELAPEMTENEVLKEIVSTPPFRASAILAWAVTQTALAQVLLDVSPAETTLALLMIGLYMCLSVAILASWLLELPSFAA